MTNYHHKAIIGMQWGDEGKGKIVDVLSEHYDIIVRFQGGNNAGHTIVKNGKTYKLSLLPSGVLTEGKKVYIGPGVVLDPLVFEKEITMLSELGIDNGHHRIGISPYTTVILPKHKQEDQAREKARSPINTNVPHDKIDAPKIGTTGRGIGPAYAARAHRDAVKLYELLDETRFQKIIEEIESDAERELYKTSLMLVKNHVHDDSFYLQNAHKNQESIIFEGAQGVLLDKDFGTYPFVTSSNTIPANIALGGPFPNSYVGNILGVFKAYTTRVGEGPFPTEQNNDLGQYLGEKGGEFGTVTGRKRRCGWLDLVLLKHMVKLCQIDQLCITKIDVLDGLEDIKIATSYHYDADKLAANHLPLSFKTAIENGDLDPIIGMNLGLIKDIDYTTLPGWKGDKTEGIRHFSDLPDNAKSYIKFIEDFIGVSIVMVSTGPDHDDTIDC